MENLDSQDLAPDPEQLIRLLELRDRFGLYGPQQRGAMTVSEQHAADYGHPLTHGCCALGWTRAA